MSSLDKIYHGSNCLIYKILYYLATAAYLMLAVIAIPIKVLHKVSWLIGPCILLFAWWKEYSSGMPLGTAIVMMPSTLGTGQFVMVLVLSAIMSMVIMFVLFRVIILRLLDAISRKRHELSMKAFAFARLTLSSSSKSLQKELDAFEASPLYRDPMVYYNNEYVSIPEL